LSGFRHVDDTEIWAGYVYRLVTGTFESPSGERFDRHIVRTPGAVTVVPIVYDEADVDRSTPRVVLISQYRAAHDKFVIEIPAGTRDVAGEADEDNVRRELSEEVGLRAGNLEYLTSIFPSTAITDSDNAIFLATDCERVERTPHGPEEEFAEIIEIPLTEAIEWVDSGKIADAKSVVGVLLAERHLRARQR